MTPMSTRMSEEYGRRGEADDSALLLPQWMTCDGRGSPSISLGYGERERENERVSESKSKSD